MQDVRLAVHSIQPLLLGGKAPGFHRVFFVAAAALALVMGQLSIGCPRNAVPCIPHPQAEIHIVEGHRKGFVQTAHFVPHAGLYQQAGTGDGGKVLHRCSAEHVAAAARLAVFVAVTRVAAKAGHDARMLQRLVRVEQLCAADGRAAGVGALPQKLREPIRIAHLHVVVQQQQVIPAGVLPAKVVDAGKVEALLRVADHLQAVVALPGFLIIGKGGRVGGVVLDDDNLKVLPAGFGPDAVQALFQIVGVVLVRDEDAYLRVAHDIPLHPVGTGEQAILHGAGASGAGQMVGQRLFGCCRHIGLGIGAAGGGACVHPPVVQHLRHMGRAAGLFHKAQEQVVVLTAVALRPLPADLIPQRLLEHRQVADVVAAQQVVRGVIRLEVGHHGPPDALGKECFIAVEEAVRLALRPQLQNGFAHGVHGVGRKDIIVVGKGQIFPCGKLCRSIGVGRNAFVFDLFVYDALILCLIFLHDALHIGMFCIGSIRKAELTVGGRLVHKGIQKFPQVFFRCIIQRGQDADGGQAAVCRRFVGHFSPLGFLHLFGGQIAGTLAKAAALDKARAPFEHGGQALVLRQLHRIACQFSGTFQSYIHIRPRRAALPCRPRKPLPYRRSFSGGRGSAMPPCCTCARSAQWSETPE